MMISFAPSWREYAQVAASPRLQNFNELMATQSPARDTVDWDSIQPLVHGELSQTQFALLDAKMTENKATVSLYNMMRGDSDAPLLGFSYSWRKK